MLPATFAALTLNLSTAAFTTIGLSLALSVFGFYASGYYAGHASLSDETSAGLRRSWMPIFLLIGLGGLFFAIYKTLYTPVAHGTKADAGEIILLALVSTALGLAVTGVAIVGLHERLKTTTAWSIAFLPGLGFLAAETLVIREAFRTAAMGQGPDNALFYFGAFEILTTLFMLFFVYGPSALGDRDPNALIMLTGLVLFLVAPLIYTLGSKGATTDGYIDPAGWFIACHIAGLLFVFMAALPAKAVKAVAQSEKVSKVDAVPSISAVARVVPARPATRLADVTDTSYNGSSYKGAEVAARAQ